MHTPVAPFGWTGFMVRRWTNKLLRNPAHRSDARSTTVAEGAVLLVATSSAHAVSAKSARQLGHDSEQLVQAAHDVQARSTAVEVFAAHNGDALASRHEDANQRLTASFDRPPRGLSVSPAFMLGVDLLVMAIEVGFWYLLAAESLSSHASLQDRLPAMLFAVFVPLAGVLTARASGLLAGRTLWARRGELDARVLVPLAAGLVLLAAAAGATYKLVAWRYDSGSMLGARQVPGSFMGALFALALLVIAVMYAALVDHQGQEDRARDKALDTLGAKAAALEAGLVAARDRWAIAAVRLYEHLDRALDDIERVLLTGQVMVLAGRAVRNDEPGTIGFTARTTDIEQMLAQPWAADLDGPAVPLRVIARAVATLQTYEPATDTGKLADALRERLHALYTPTADDSEASVTTDAVPAHLSVVPQDSGTHDDDASQELTGA